LNGAQPSFEGGVYLASFSFRLVGDTKGQVDGNMDHTMSISAASPGMLN